MPKRTNEKQEIIALLRQLVASQDCVVAESRMLRCSRTGDLREVDVVVECKIHDVIVTISFEVIDHGRKADVSWVEQMIQKHQGLPTNKLILVSWSGFTEGARRKVASEPTVLAVTPEVAIEGGNAVAKDLFADEVTLSLRKVVLLVKAGGAEPVRVAAFPDNILYQQDGTEAGTAHDLATVMLNAPAIMERVLREAHNHPEREEVKWFVIGVPLEQMSLALRKEPEQELHPIQLIEVSGEITWSQQRVDLEVRKFGEIVFGHGRAVLGGRSALMVATVSEAGAISRVSTRIYPEAPT